MPRRRPEFEPGKAAAEAAKLEKFCDAGRSQIQWLTDAGRLRLFGREQYNVPGYDKTGTDVEFGNGQGNGNGNE